jgi:hypothetical protein
MTNAASGKGPENEVNVTVLYTRTSKSKAFDIAKNATLSQMFDEAYKLLGEPKQSNDTYFCKNGTDLSNVLSKTVESVINSECKERYFEIRGPTGGAQRCLRRPK